MALKMLQLYHIMSVNEYIYLLLGIYI